MSTDKTWVKQARRIVKASKTAVEYQKKRGGKAKMNPNAALLKRAVAMIDEMNSILEDDDVDFFRIFAEILDEAEA